MTATLEIDDELYSLAVAKADRTGREVSDLVAEGLRLVVLPAPEKENETSQPKLSLREALLMAQEAVRNAPEGKTAREILEEGRSRLESR